MALEFWNVNLNRTTTPLADPTHVMVIEIVGQSNQQGTSSLIGDAPFNTSVAVNQYLGNEDKISIWDKIESGATYMDVIPSDPATWAPMDASWGRGGQGVAPGTIGPEVSLCHRIFQAWRPKHLYVIKCTRGGTALAKHAEADQAQMDWNFNSVGEWSVYQTWKHGYHAPAMQSIAATHGSGRIWHGGVFWLQGASDARDSVTPGTNNIIDSTTGLEAHAAYHQNLTALLNGFRAEIGASVPLIVGRSENYHESTDATQKAENGFIQNIRDQQGRVVQNFSNCELVHMDNKVIDGFTTFPYSDFEHWTGEGQIHSGEAQAGKAIEINAPLYNPIIPA